MSGVTLIAEVGINHNGDLDVCEKLIRIASDAKWDYVKFQKRNVELCVPPEKREVLKSTPWGDIPYYEYKKKLELGAMEYNQISYFCRIQGIGWFASPWDTDSVSFLSNYEMDYIKVASASVTDLKLLEAVRYLDIPVVVSTGMSTKEQVDRALDVLGDRVVYLLACTSTYPSKPEEQNLKHILTLKKEYPHLKIGFSNHSPGIIFAAASVLYGAEMIECHVTLDRAMFGSDQSASFEPEGMRKLYKYVQSLSLAIGSGNWEVFESERDVMRNLRWKDFR